MQGKRPKDKKEMARARLIHPCDPIFRFSSLVSHRSSCRFSLSTAVQIDETYFDSYSYFDIHRDMLGDKVGHCSRDLPGDFAATFLQRGENRGGRITARRS